MVYAQNFDGRKLLGGLFQALFLRFLVGGAGMSGAATVGQVPGAAQQDST